MRGEGQSTMEMTHRPRITEESVLARWMGMEMARINEGVVAERKTLGRLLREEAPRAKTRGGGDHPFSRTVLEALGRDLPAEIRENLRLPILFYFDVDVKDSCYLADETAARSLQILGDLGEGRRFREGKLWVARAIAFSIAQKYPTAVQIAMA